LYRFVSLNFFRSAISFALSLAYLFFFSDPLIFSFSYQRVVKLNIRFLKFEIGDDMTETVLQVRSNGQITLPSGIRRKANIKEGDLLEIVVEADGTLRLVPQIAINRSQAYFWTRRWQEGEREADEDLMEGRFEDFSSIEDLIADLEKDAP
jgi:AbrB family looped-hinge helix DNA binding protein